MDLPRLERMNKHWLKSPPVHYSVAAYLGWGKSGGASSPEQGSFELDQRMAQAPTIDMRPKHG
jgi:hypothetical protein